MWHVPTSLHTLTSRADVDKIIEAIDRLRAPLDQTDREERIIRAGYVPFVQSLIYPLTAIKS